MLVLDDHQETLLMLRDYLSRHPELEPGPEELAEKLDVDVFAVSVALEALRDDESELLA
ncbi:MAG: hypothetical protein IRY88_10145 [Rubrobacteraceae bacterium]|uniref:hypothetical protein n=1 Tax=Rubrobacter calidifluminis TaxID=1392640 RepID=UPI00235E71F4|nr:hypothetical protein [Rubrobacter calidifluminis]MBX6764026.1 hypothetical protein [Rubrobacteraceae bacterium]